MKLADAFVAIALAALLIVAIYLTTRQNHDPADLAGPDAPVDYDRIYREHRPDYRGYCLGCLRADHGRVPHADCPQLRLGSHADAARLRGDWERALGGGQRG